MVEQNRFWDTNIVSELNRREPNSEVFAWGQIEISLAILFSIVFIWAHAGCVLGEGDSSNPPHPKAIAFVLEHIDCSNPSYVAQIVFSEFSHEMFEDDAWKVQSSASEVDLGDGTTSYIFAAPGGNGSWAVRPNYHFVVEDGQARLLFDAKGWSSGYLVEQAKFNGRYLLQRSGNTYVNGTERPNQKDVALVYETYFWTDVGYDHVYTEYVFALPNGSTPRKSEWVAEAKEKFFASRVTWSYTVSHFDTLMKISHQYSTELEEVMSQNDIEDPDVIFDGQVLMYDSLKTESGKHSFKLFNTGTEDGGD